MQHGLEQPAGCQRDPTVAANAAHGKMARADRQVALLHCAIVRCAFKTTLTTMALIITAPKTATCRHLPSPVSRCALLGRTPVLDQPLPVTAP
jgi:hypothetical protein